MLRGYESASLRYAALVVPIRTLAPLRQSIKVRVSRIERLSYSGRPLPNLVKPMVPSSLRENVVKDALKSFAWVKLERHLLTIQLNPQGATKLVDLIRKNADFLLKRPDPAREQARATFVTQLAQYLGKAIGADTATQIGALMTLVQTIEAGYCEILRSLSESEAAKLLPEVQVSSALARSCYGYDELMKEFWADATRRKKWTAQSLRVRRSDGTNFNPDGVLGNIVGIATMTLLLLGHQNGWFDADGFLVLPTLPVATSDEIDKAGATELLAASWRQWERVEQRSRYFGGRLKVVGTGSSESGAKTAIEYDHVAEAEFYDFLANERLADRLLQTYQEMSVRTSIHETASGIAGPLDLPPAAYVSPTEGHSGVSISEILGYVILDDEERPCGLRLLEWVRGYSALQCLAEERHSVHGQTGLCFIVPREELREILERVGLKNGAADIFIDGTSLRATSRDLFDQPLLKMHDGSVLVFGPAILNSDPARVTLSAIGKQGQQLARKGKAFEREMLRFFVDQGFAAKTFKLKVDGQEFECDVAVPWDDYVFLFECKNRSLSGHNPIAAHYFAMETDSAVDQVIRLADAVRKHADAVFNITSIDVNGKTIVACILNSLPFAVNGDRKGVCITDASALKRFFQDRHFHVVHVHNMTKAPLLHRTPMKALWTGDRPTPSDLLAYLRDPLALQLMIGHAGPTQYQFALGERATVTVTDLTRKEMTTGSIARLFSVDRKWVEREEKAVSRAVSEAKRRQEQRIVREADRRWRERRQRTPSGVRSTP